MLAHLLYIEYETVGQLVFNRGTRVIDHTRCNHNAACRTA